MNREPTAARSGRLLEIVGPAVLLRTVGLMLALALAAPSSSLAEGEAVIDDAAPDFSAGVAALQAGDFAEALAILEPLADAGDNRSRFLLGQIYADGLGVTPDRALALDLWRAAAEPPSPSAYALYNLGVAHERGDGVETDAGAAADFYARAAARGLAAASLNLAVLYLEGRGVAEDGEQALRHGVDALLRGQSDAGRLLDLLAGRHAAAPATAGTWQIADHLSAPDRLARRTHGDALDRVIGRSLRLTTGRFQLGPSTCNQVSYLSEPQDLRALLLTTTGATDPLLPVWPDAMPRRGDEAVAITVVCGGTVPAALLAINGGPVIVTFADGYLAALDQPSPTIAGVQDRLARAGYDPGPADGVLGPRTLAAAEAFGTDVGLNGAGLLSRRFDDALRLAADRSPAPPTP